MNNLQLLYKKIQSWNSTKRHQSNQKQALVVPPLKVPSSVLNLTRKSTIPRDRKTRAKSQQYLQINNQKHLSRIKKYTFLKITNTSKLVQRRKVSKMQHHASKSIWPNDWKSTFSSLKVYRSMISQWALTRWSGHRFGSTTGPLRN